MCGSPASCSTMVCASRDLPMPGSPETSTIWPLPALACSHRRASSAISSSRPTIGVVAMRSASKRLSTMLGRSATKARMVPSMPLSSCGPRSSSSKRLPSSFRVLSAMTTMFGSAMLCNRAATFGVCPTIPRSCASPDPIRSPITTIPVAIPTRVCSGAGALTAATAAINSSPARTALSASSSCACG
jgi:hypothetical protein